MLSHDDLNQEKKDFFLQIILNGDRIEYGFCDNDNLRCVGYDENKKIIFSNDEEYNITKDIQYGMNLYLKYYLDKEIKYDSDTLLNILDSIKNIPDDFFQNMNKLF